MRTPTPGSGLLLTRAAASPAPLRRRCGAECQLWYSRAPRKRRTELPSFLFLQSIENNRFPNGLPGINPGRRPAPQLFNTYLRVSSVSGTGGSL